MGEVYILAAGLQLTVFLAVFIVSFLTKKDIAARILRGIAGIFVIISSLDFIHVFANIYPEIWPWLASSNNLFLITHPLLFINGILFLVLLSGLKKGK